MKARLPLAAGGLAGMAAAACFMLMAWQHNPQGEFHDPVTGAVYWGGWLMVGVFWFVPAALAGAGVTALLGWLRKP